jgi:RNA-directed DNA polymerase
MAKTIASGVGMTNAWLADQGVLSLKTLWAELAHLR